jgi:hypothetical protein
LATIASRSPASALAGNGASALSRIAWLGSGAMRSVNCASACADGRPRMRSGRSPVSSSNSNTPSA